MNRVQEHPTWQIIDSTKLQCFQQCPRLYFYNYILGWQFESPSIHLEFGTAWHLAMEHLLTDGYDEANIILAYNRLLQHYRKFWSELMDDTNYPKCPGFALDMLRKYVRKYPDDHRNADLLYAETSGTVAIGTDRIIYFKTDSILRGKNNNYMNRAFSREHKTASKRGTYWNMKIQVGTYSHVLFSLFGPSDVYGVEMNEAFFQKTRPDFERTQILKDPLSMNVWLWEVNELFDRIDYETDRMLQCNEEDRFMAAFPRNTESCNHWGKCEFYDYCMSWHNPLQHLDRVPMGMTVRFWNPAEQETTNKMDLS